MKVLHNEEVRNYIICAIRSWRIRRTARVTSMGEIINAYKILLGSM